MNSITKSCKIDGCLGRGNMGRNGNRHFIHGYCQKHFWRWKRHGDPLYVSREYHSNRDGPEYRIWRAMKTRCYNKNQKFYANYGGRGITVCDRWLNSFSAFLEDMGKKPSPKHSIDRIDNDGNYEPGNCKWSTPSQQTLNSRTRVDNKSGVRGVSFRPDGNRYIAYISVDGVRTFLGHGFKTLEEAKAARDLAYSKLMVK